MDLILIITYKCNQDCSYCPTVKKNISMTWRTAKKALGLYKGKRVKLFGGEPLLEYELITKIAKQRFKFELTTNGTLLDAKKTGFFRQNNFELAVSIDGDAKTHELNRGSWKFVNNLDKEYPIINMVAAPSNVNRFSENIAYLHKLGFRKFNILPAYFEHWSVDDAKNFEFQLKSASEFINANQIYVKNKDVHNQEYLFNTGWVVDCNGDLYATNKIMLVRYSFLKTKMLLGNIHEMDELPEIKPRKIELDDQIHHQQTSHR